MSNLTYLAGCGGVTLAAVVMLATYLDQPLRTLRVLRYQLLTLLLIALSLAIGPDGGLLVDAMRPIGCAWVIHTTLHFTHGNGGHHA